MKTLHVIGLALLGFAGSALAGFTNHYQVNISGNTAWGSFIGARNSADAVQFISCASVNFTGSSVYGICQARTATNVTKTCTTTDPAHLEAIRGLSNESYIYMRWTDAGICDYLYVSTGSIYHE